MISICIPIYNYSIKTLITDLSEQAINSSIDYEIIAIDDASTNETTIKENRSINQPCFTYIELKKNIGRSKIRNLLAEKAKFHYLIFMDCDSALPDSKYINRYIDICKKNIICSGGRAYQEQRPIDNTYLRWKYGLARECANADKRSKYPNQAFHTNNFLIDKEIFNTVKFNEDLIGYGHEDTLFGLDLAQHHLTIQHINNPLIHIGLEDAKTFLNKTEEALRNIVKIEDFIQNNYNNPVHFSTLFKAKKQIAKYHLQSIATVLFKLSKNAMKKNLLGNNPYLLIFDLYKLGYLITCSKR